MKTPLHLALKRLLTEGGSQNFMIIHLDTHYYMQVAAQAGSQEATLEAVSNSNLPAQKQLNLASQEKMIDLGWVAPHQKGENYSLNVIIDSEEAYDKYVGLFEETARYIFAVYEIQADMIELVLE